jgi:hypothetical protein
MASAVQERDSTRRGRSARGAWPAEEGAHFGFRSSVRIGAVVGPLGPVLGASLMQLQVRLRTGLVSGQVG